jgi:hypothetical protein
MQVDQSLHAFAEITVLQFGTCSLPHEATKFVQQVLASDNCFRLLLLTTGISGPRALRRLYPIVCLEAYS